VRSSRRNSVPSRRRRIRPGSISFHLFNRAPISTQLRCDSIVWLSDKQHAKGIRLPSNTSIAACHIKHPFKLLAVRLN
jgi:hypothetical protein